MKQNCIIQFLVRRQLKKYTIHIHVPTMLYSDKVYVFFIFINSFMHDWQAALVNIFCILLLLTTEGGHKIYDSATWTEHP